MSTKLLNFLLIVLPTVLYFGYISPYYTGSGGFVWTPENSIKNLQILNVQYTNTLNQIGLINDAAESLNKDYHSVDKDMIRNIMIMLPDDIDTVKLRNEVLQIGSSVGVAINNIKIEKDTRSDKRFNFYRISFDIKTKYSTFKKFMEEYEKNKRVFSLEKATISRPIRDEDDKTFKAEDADILNIAIVSRVYFMK